jgi:hypothetical protein
MQLAGLFADATRSSTSQAGLAGSSGSVGWFVQLSDLHINKWVHPEILPDLAAFGQQVLTSVRPGAVLITGDLVDAKTRPEGSHQYEEEWQVCLCTSDCRACSSVARGCTSMTLSDMHCSICPCCELGNRQCGCVVVANPCDGAAMHLRAVYIQMASVFNKPSALTATACSYCLLLSLALPAPTACC